jgi:hypothetical protein
VVQQIVSAMGVDGIDSAMDPRGETQHRGTPEQVECRGPLLLAQIVRFDQKVNEVTVPLDDVETVLVMQNPKMHEVVEVVVG